MKNTYCGDRTEGKNMKSEILTDDPVEVAKGSSKGITTDSLSSGFLKGSGSSILVETAIDRIKGTKGTKDKLMNILMKYGIVNVDEIPTNDIVSSWKGCNKTTVRNIMKLKNMR